MQPIRRSRHVDLLTSDKMEIRIHPGSDRLIGGRQVDENLVSEKLDHIDLGLDGRVRRSGLVGPVALNEVLRANPERDLFAVVGGKRIGLGIGYAQSEVCGLSIELTVAARDGCINEVHRWRTD